MSRLDAGGQKYTATKLARIYGPLRARAPSLSPKRLGRKIPALLRAECRMKPENCISWTTERKRAELA